MLKSRSSFVKLICFLIVLLCTHAVLVAPVHDRNGILIILSCSKKQPVKRFIKTLFNPDAFQIHFTNPGLCIYRTLLRGFAIPLRRQIHILSNAEANIINTSECQLSGNIAALGLANQKCDFCIFAHPLLLNIF
jgi:hypothetical protein